MVALVGKYSADRKERDMILFKYEDNGVNGENQARI